MTSIFAKLVSSKIATACRVASASAAIAGLQCWPAQPRGRRALERGAAARSAGRRRSARTSWAAPSRTSRRRPRRGPRAARTSARSAAAGRPGAPRSGSGCRSRSRRPRSSGRASTRATASAGRRTAGCPCATGRAPARRRRSSVATWRPIPPAPAIPWAQNPAATKNPRTSLSPRMNSLSGVKPSGPLIIRETPASAIDGHAPDRAGHDLLEPRPVGREQLAVEVGRDAVERPRRRVALVAAHAQAADLLAEVDEVVRVAELGQAGVDAVDRLGEEVLVGHRHDRDRDAGEPADLGGEHPAGVDDDVGRDRLPRAVAELDARRRSPGRARRRSRRPRVWVRTVDPALPRARRERHGPARTGRASRRSAARPRRGRRRSTSAGSGRAPPSAPISSSGSPNVLAQPAWRWSSSKRARDDASRSEPTSCHDGSTPVSSRRAAGTARRRTSSSSSGSRSCGAGRRARPSGTSSRR